LFAIYVSSTDIYFMKSNLNTPINIFIISIFSLVAIVPPFTTRFLYAREAEQPEFQKIKLAAQKNESEISKEIPTKVSGVKEIESKSGTKKFLLSFDDADINEVIRAFGEIFNIDYIIDRGVTGRVNIHTVGKITEPELFEIFGAILRVAGAAIVKEGRLYHIVPMAGAKTKMLVPKFDLDGESIPPTDDILFQIIRLKYLPVEEFVSIIKPFLSPGAVSIPYHRSNLLFLVEFGRNVIKVLEILEIIDINSFDNVKLKLYPIEVADVSELSEDMENLFSALNAFPKSGDGIGIKFIPIIRLNSLLTITSVPELMEEVDKWVKELDRKVEGDDVNTYIYHVKNGIADELADILNRIFGGARAAKSNTVPRIKKQKREIKSLRGRNNPPNAPKRNPVNRTTLPPRNNPLGKTTLSRGEIEIIPYSPTNTIIINATPKDYKAVIELLKELDIIPRQVLVKILILEVSLLDDKNFGVEYAAISKAFGKNFSGSIAGTSLGLSTAGALASGGLTASLVNDNFFATLNALESKSMLKVLASPHILARDGVEANIDIGEEVPLVASRTFIDNREEISIERRDTGVILSVTPHINSSGLVTLDLSLEMSNVAGAVVEGESDIRIFQRKTSNSMVVQDGQSILIGGLIKNQDEVIETKVPLLGDIPILKNLFRNVTKIKSKNELILLITPTVLKTPKAAHDATEKFKKELQEIRLRLNIDQKQSPNKNE